MRLIIMCYTSVSTDVDTLFNYLLIPTLNCCYSGFTLNLIIDCYQAYNFIVGRHTISRFNRILNDFMLRETKGHEWMNMYETSCNRLLAKSDRHVSCIKASRKLWNVNNIDVLESFETNRDFNANPLLDSMIGHCWSNCWYGNGYGGPFDQSIIVLRFLWHAANK